MTIKILAICGAILLLIASFTGDVVSAITGATFIISAKLWMLIEK
jgi:hypothetical protein